MSLAVLLFLCPLTLKVKLKKTDMTRYSSEKVMNMQSLKDLAYILSKIKTTTLRSLSKQET